MEAATDMDKIYSAIKNLLFRYNLVPSGFAAEQLFLTELAMILQI